MLAMQIYPLISFAGDQRAPAPAAVGAAPGGPAVPGDAAPHQRQGPAQAPRLVPGQVRRTNLHRPRGADVSEHAVQDLLRPAPGLRLCFAGTLQGYWFYLFQILLLHFDISTY